MFTWICPKCGREVPPSYTDCPNCTLPQQAPAPAPPPPPPGPQQPVYAAPPQAAYQPPPAYAPPPPQAPQPAYNPPPPAYAQQPAYAPPQQQAYGQPQYAPLAPVYAEPPQRRLPEWLVMVLVAVGAVGLFALAYFYLLPSFRKNGSAAPGIEKASVEKAAAGKQHPYAKFLEVVGIRVIEDARQNVQVKFMVVNHSSAELAGVSADVTLKPVNSKPDTPPVTEFTFKIPTLGPYEAKEVTVPAKTKLRAYEMPDWQFMQSEVQITSSK